jgi:hypothetical protein
MMDRDPSNVDQWRDLRFAAARKRFWRVDAVRVMAKIKLGFLALMCLGVGALSLRAT